MRHGLSGGMQSATNWQSADESSTSAEIPLTERTDEHKNDRLQSAIDGGLSLADQVVVSAANFLTVVFVSRNCTPQETGSFALAWTLVNFVRTVQERTIATPYMVFANHHDTHQATFLGSTLIHQLGLSMFASVAVLLMSAIEAWQGDTTFATVLVATALCIPLLMLRECVRSISFAHFRFSTALALDCLASCTQILAVAALAVSGKLSIINVTLVMGLACLIPSLLWISDRYAALSFRRGHIVADWFRNWRYARWLLAARLLGMGGFLVMPWLVLSFLSSAEVGTFAVCNNLVGILLLFVTGMNNYFQPRAIRELREHGIQSMWRSILGSSGFVLSVLLIIAAVFWFAGDHLLAAIYGQPYGAQGSFLFVLALSVAAVSPSILFGNGLAAIERTELQIWSEGVYFGLTISLGLWLIPRYELIGAATALFVGGLAASGLSGVILLSLARPANRDGSNLAL